MWNQSQKHLFAVRSGAISSVYLRNYNVKMKTMAGRWQLKQLGFGPIETYKLVRATNAISVIYCMWICLHWSVSGAVCHVNKTLTAHS